MSKKPEATFYMRVGSKEQLSKRLDRVHGEIVSEEERMKTLAKEFMESSEKYNKLRSKQRSLMGQLFVAKGSK